MSLLIAVETHDLAHVFLVPFPSLASNLCRIDSGGLGGGILEFLGIPLTLVIFLLFILPGFIRRLGILSKSGYGSRCGAFSRWLGVISAMIFPRSLGLDLVRGGVSRSVPSETTQISFSHVGTWA